MVTDKGPPGINVSILPEPELEFRYGQRLQDPHAGLALFGPADADSSFHQRSLTYGVIGAPEGIAAFRRWSEYMQGPIMDSTVSEEEAKDLGEGKEYLIWPPFPGFEAAFDSAWYPKPAWTHAVDRDKLLHMARHKDANKRAYDVVNLYNNAIRIASERDEAFSVFVCVVPEEVWNNCRPKSKVKKGHGGSPSKKARQLRRLQPDLFGRYEPEEYDLSVDFRRQLKARSMQYGVPIQIIRETTLRKGPPTSDNRRQMTPESDRAWNLSTALYYKGGGRPWRLSTARDGVCYIGLAFRRTQDSAKPETACCAAQMFLDTGDGIVFRGDYGPWYSRERKQYHLDRESARRLLEGVLKTYEEQGGKRLREIFLHSRSAIDADEFAGYEEACPGGVRLVGIRVRQERRGVKLYRRGNWPVLRGTLWRLNSRTAFLWTSGFKPALLTYDGHEVPNPLRIDIQHGEAEIDQVASDIFGLTKLNYNSCKLGDSEPVTVGFSDAVGEILVSNPTVEYASPSFKFYI